MEDAKAFGAVIHAVALGTRLRARPAEVDGASFEKSALRTPFDARAQVQRAVRALSALRAGRSAALEAGAVTRKALFVHVFTC